MGLANSGEQTAIEAVRSHPVTAERVKRSIRGQLSGEFTKAGSSALSTGHLRTCLELNCNSVGDAGGTGTLFLLASKAHSRARTVLAAGAKNGCPGSRKMRIPLHYQDYQWLPANGNLPIPYKNWPTGPFLTLITRLPR